MAARTQFSDSVDGFRLAYDRGGTGRPVVLLHGWPGDRRDFADVIDQLPDVDAVAVDLRGFGESDKPASGVEQYSAQSQARSIVGLIDELGLDRPVLAGYDVGSRVAQAAAWLRPDQVSGLVLSPPLPGVGDRILGADVQADYWYQAFHQLPLMELILDGRRDAVHSYLSHFWQHWSAPGYEPDAMNLERLADLYGRPGALVASINYYRAGAGAVRQSLSESAPPRAERIATPTTVIWPGSDTLVRREWSDRLDDYFAHLDLRIAENSGHFTPVEAPDLFAAAVQEYL